MPSFTVLSRAEPTAARLTGSEPPPEPDQPPGPEGVSSIRSARLDDLPRLIRIEQACFDEGDALSPRSLRHALTRANATLLVNDREGRVAGYALVFKREGCKVAWLNSLAVDPAFRGMGIGKRLLNAAEVHARKQGYQGMRLEVRPDNLAALALYQQEGYDLVSTIPGFYADGTDALRYRKNLSAQSPSAARRASS